MKRQTLFITRTAMFIAILIVMQILTKAFGQIVTGSCVNMVLAVSAVICGAGSAAAVAIISPFMAFLLGIGTPVIQIVPLISVGNLVYVLLLAVFEQKYSGRPMRVMSVIVASVLKFATLFITVTRIALPLIGLPDTKASVISASFSWPQLISALIGGMLAIEICGLVKKSKKSYN